MAMFTRPLGPTLASETTQAIAAANTLESAVLAASDDQTLAAQLLPAWAPIRWKGDPVIANSEPIIDRDGQPYVRATIIWRYTGDQRWLQHGAFHYLGGAALHTSCDQTTAILTVTARATAIQTAVDDAVPRFTAWVTRRLDAIQTAYTSARPEQLSNVVRSIRTRRNVLAAAEALEL